MRKIAGKTLANPLNNGYPRDESKTATPIAKAAMNPLNAKTSSVGLFFPFGAGLAFQVNDTPRIANRIKPANPIVISVRPADFPISVALTIIIPQIDHTNKESNVMLNPPINPSSLINFGPITQIERNTALISMPSGITDIDSKNSV